MRIYRWLAVFCLLCPALRAQPRGAPDSADLALPELGSVVLRVLSPGTLEITQISRPNDGWRMVGARLDSPVNAFAGLRVSAGPDRLAIAAVGWKRRAAYADFHRPDLRVATSLYLQLRSPLAPGAWVDVADDRGAILAAGKTLHASSSPLRPSPAIHVNQEGYVPEFPKSAMVGYYLGDLGELAVAPGTPFAIVDARTRAPQFRGRLRARPELNYPGNPAPYQDVLEANFSAFSRPGEYCVEVEGLGLSEPFLIDEGIAMGFARTYALGLYEQRCGTASVLPFTRFVHGACHTAPADVPSPDSDPRFAFTWKTINRYATEGSAEFHQTAPFLADEAAALYPFVRKGKVDVSGGHHDAGDYSKYTENSAELVHYLLFTVDAFASASLDNLGIPESGDGIPDILQEAKWEADFLAKMQDEDGGFYFLVYPIDREYESNVPPDRGDAQVVWPKTTSVTAASVAALAECGSSPLFRRYYPKAAQAYLEKARRGWRFLQAAIARYGRDGSYQKITFYSDRWGPNDELAWAAAALYAATGEKAYQNLLFQWFPDPADSATFRWGWWRMSDGWGNAIRDYAFAARTGRLPASALDPRYLGACESQIVAAGDDVVSWSADSAYQTPFPDSYKSHNGGGWYFSLDQASDAAIASLVMDKPDYLKALVGAMNYEAGCNPLNRPFLTGLGLPRQREIVSQYAENERRILPPSGIPIGNTQGGYDFSPLYGTQLRDLCYPADSAGFPLFDRWTDAHNVTREYIAVNQARALLASVCLAGRTRAAAGRWTFAQASIGPLPASAQLGKPLTLNLDLGANAPESGTPRIVWEGRDQEPVFGRTFAMTPQKPGPQWVEAEAEWPDGRRVFAAAEFDADSPTVIWFRDGAFPEGSNAGKKDAADLREQWFTGAPEPLTVGKGDRLYAWVRLDPARPPREIMVAWNDGKSWEHRAYWGANRITYGENNSPGRFHAGDLPAPGSWARLVIPAAAVGLAGGSANGMSFSLLGGDATFGAVGRER